jgi:hypothetical protein
MLFHRAVGDVEIQVWSMVLFYDTASGDIRHIHQCISLKGATHKTKQQIERDAKATLRRHAGGRPIPRGLSLLHVDPNGIDWKHPHRVDPKRRVLVKVRLPKPPREAKAEARPRKAAPKRKRTSRA